MFHKWFFLLYKVGYIYVVNVGYNQRIYYAHLRPHYIGYIFVVNVGYIYAVLNDRYRLYVRPHKT